MAQEAIYVVILQEKVEVTFDGKYWLATKQI